MRMLALIVLCFCLASCWMPEEFTATLNVDSSQHYTFTYDGNIAFGPALGEIKERGKLLPHDEAEMKGGEAGFRKDPGFKTADYIGAGRFKVHYEVSGVVEDGKQVFLDLVVFHVGPDGRISILGANISPQDRQRLSDIGLKLDGQLKITSDLTVVQHNATSTPHLGGLIGSYQWHVTLDQSARPSIVLQGNAPPEAAPQATDPAIQQKDLSKLIIGKWQGNKSQTLVFSEGGSYLLDPQGITGNWKIDSNNLTLTSRDGNPNVIPILHITANELSLRGHHHSDDWVKVKLDSEVKPLGAGSSAAAGETSTNPSTKEGSSSNSSDSSPSRPVLLSQYPLLSQKDPANYRDVSLMTATDEVNDSKTESVQNLACAATVYVMIQRGRGNSGSMVDDFYEDPRKPDGSGRGAARPAFVGSDESWSPDVVIKELEAGNPVVLHAIGGPLLQHFMLAVGLEKDSQGNWQLRVLDPWPGNLQATPGRSISLPLNTEPPVHPLLANCAVMDFRRVVPVKDKPLSISNSVSRGTAEGSGTSTEQGVADVAQGKSTSLPSKLIDAVDYSKAIIGRWFTGRHIYIFHSDGTWGIEGGEERIGLWHIEGDKLEQATSVGDIGGTIVSLTDSELVYTNNKVEFRCKRVLR